MLLHGDVGLLDTFLKSSLSLPKNILDDYFQKIISTFFGVRFRDPNIGGITDNFNEDAYLATNWEIIEKLYLMGYKIEEKETFLNFIVSDYTNSDNFISRIIYPMFLDQNNFEKYISTFKELFVGELKNLIGEYLPIALYKELYNKQEKGVLGKRESGIFRAQINRFTLMVL